MTSAFLRYCSLKKVFFEPAKLQPHLLQDLSFSYGHNPPPATLTPLTPANTQVAGCCYADEESSCHSNRSLLAPKGGNN